MTKDLGGPSQLGFVVPNVDAAAKIWWERYGVGPWRVWDFAPEQIDDAMLDEKPASYSMRIGVSKWGELDLELIEPLEETSIYARSLVAHGGKPHLHHVRSRPSDYEGAVESFRERGLPAIMSGNIAGGIFHYFGTEEEIGTVVEISRVPEKHDLPPGETIYPSEEAS